MATIDLETLTIRELQERYAAAFGKPTASRNRRWLLSKLADAPAVEVPAKPRRRVRKQAQRPAAPMAPAVAALGLTVGTTLERTYKDQQVVLTITAEGFEVRGTVYRSLSAAATAVAGCNWNGHVFFGLKSRSGGRA